MVITLDGQNRHWEHKYEGGGSLHFPFASVSVRKGNAPTIKVSVVKSDGHESVTDIVTPTVPHSWWGVTRQPIAPPLLNGDTLKIEMLGEESTVDIRLDCEDM